MIYRCEWFTKKCNCSTVVFPTYGFIDEIKEQCKKFNVSARLFKGKKHAGYVFNDGWSFLE